MLVRALAAAAVLAILPLKVPSVGATSSTDLVCGDNPVSDVVLSQDLTCASSLVFDAPGDEPVRIDLQGHTLTITTPDAPCVVNQPPGTQPMCAVVARRPVEIVHGTIAGSLGLASSTDRSLASAVIVEGDVWMSGAGGALIRSRVHEGSVHALGAEDTIQWSVVRGGSISFDDTTSALTLSITHNRVIDSPDAGISGMLGGGGEFQDDVVGDISWNTVEGSLNAGIDFAGSLTNFGAFTLTANNVRANGGDGIRIGGIDDPPTPFVGGPMTLTKNAAIHNEGSGIIAGWVSNVAGTGIVDGGANTAFNNRTPPPCTGVVCS
jgi:hypothetical protein